VRVGVSLRPGTADDNGTGDEGAGGKHGEGAFGEQTNTETAASGEFAKALGGNTLAGTGHPGKKRRGSDGGDGGA
jgi:hypothetical protein